LITGTEDVYDLYLSNTSVQSFKVCIMVASHL